MRFILKSEISISIRKRKLFLEVLTGSNFHLFPAHFTMNSRSLMVCIQFQRLRELCLSLLEILQTELAKTHHIMAVHFVSLIQIIFEYQEVRQRNGEIVNFHVVEQVLFPIIGKLIEASFGLLQVS